MWNSSAALTKKTPIFGLMISKRPAGIKVGIPASLALREKICQGVI